MKTLSFKILFLSIILLSGCSPYSDLEKSKFNYNSISSPIVLIGINFVDVESEKIHEDMWVWIKNGIIVKTGKMDDFNMFFSKAIVLNCSGKYILPGMIGYAGKNADNDYLKKSLKNGITALQYDGNNRNIFNAFQSGKYILPEIISYSSYKVNDDYNNKSPYKYLHSVTFGAAMHLNYKNAGLIKNGFKADLILFNTNPVVRNENLQDIYCVIKNGYILDSSVLEKL